MPNGSGLHLIWRRLDRHRLTRSSVNEVVETLFADHFLLLPTILLAQTGSIAGVVTDSSERSFPVRR